MNARAGEARLPLLIAVVVGALFTSTGAIAQQSPQPGPLRSGGSLDNPHGAPASAGAIQLLDGLALWERQDLGKTPTKELHSGSMHAPTPNEVPGGQLVTTKELIALLQRPQGSNALVFDVLGGPKRIPKAIPAVVASASGSFDDPPQKQLAKLLQRETGGNRKRPLVFYCQGRQCWMSYNAALRAINLGYTNVLWYRGGLDAWQRAGLPLEERQQSVASPPS